MQILFLDFVSFLPNARNTATFIGNFVHYEAKPHKLRQKI